MGCGSEGKCIVFPLMAAFELGCKNCASDSVYHMICDVKMFCHSGMRASGIAWVDVNRIRMFLQAPHPYVLFQASNRLLRNTCTSAYVNVSPLW